MKTIPGDPNSINHKREKSDYLLLDEESNTTKNNPDSGTTADDASAFSASPNNSFVSGVSTSSITSRPVLGSWIDPYQPAIQDTYYHKELNQLRPNFQSIQVYFETFLLSLAIGKED